MAIQKDINKDILKAIEQLRDFPKTTFFDSVLGHPKAINEVCDHFIWNESKSNLPNTHFTDASLFGMSVIKSDLIPEKTWKIPMLSEKVQCSQKVRDQINKTLQGFGKTTVVYMFDTKAIDRMLWNDFSGIVACTNIKD